MTDKPTVFDALTQVRRGMPAIAKDRTAPANQGGYAFAGIESYLAHANPLMDEAGLHVVPYKVLDRTYQERTTGSNKIMHAVFVTMQYRVYGPAGDFIEGEMIGEAADMGDKSSPKAATAARKAFLKELLRITSEGDDPDAGDPDVTVENWYVANGWKDQAEHDAAHRVLVERISAAPEPIREALKRTLSEEGIKLKGQAITRDEHDAVEGWLGDSSGSEEVGVPLAPSEPVSTSDAAGSPSPPAASEELEERARALAEKAKPPSARSPLPLETS